MMLNTPISIKDLVNNNGCMLEINADFNKDDDENADQPSELFSVFPDPDDIRSDPKAIKSPWEKSFAELKEYMTEIDHGIYKKVVREGSGETPKINYQVTIHYNGFWENELETFDSTFVRAKPQKFVTGRYDILEGLELAVLSMKRGEEAQYVIPYQLLFGECGCPPRIREKADGLFIVTLLDFAPCGDENAMENLTPEERKSFPVVYKKVEEIRSYGRTNFKQGHYRNAARAFHKAIDSLESCNLRDHDDEQLQTTTIISLYTNLAIIYNKLELPSKVCSMCNEISRLSNINQNCKAVFQEGRALIKLGDYQKAKRKLHAALSLEPNNEEIKKELRILAQKAEKFDREQKEMCRKAFGMLTVLNDKKPTDEEQESISEDFQKAVKEIFTHFMTKKENFFSIPDGFSDKEIEFIKIEAEKLNMIVEVAEKVDGKEYILKRK